MSTFAYCRVSTLDQARDGAGSLDAQATMCANVAKLHNLEITETFTDAGVSGAKRLRDRPAGAALLARVQSGDTVIAAKLDRAFRNTEDTLAVASMLQDQGVKLILRDISADPVNANGTGAFFLTVLAALATLERETIRERTMIGRAAKVAAGGHGGGSAQYGWSRVGDGRFSRREVNVAEQEVIGRMRALRSQGRNLVQIAAEVGAESRTGKPFTATQVKRILAAA